MTSVFCDVLGKVGLVTLQRPKALNALSLEMTQSIHETLNVWAQDPEIHLVILQSACEKSFCAGGDIRALWREGISYTQQLLFFREEYALNATLCIYPKPVIALMNGLTLGGGMGLAMHLPYRVVTEKAILGMPETGIGFFPDVGAAYFLNKVPEFFGIYMGLTGFHLPGAQAVSAGLGTHFVSSSSLEKLVLDFINLEEISVNDIEKTLEEYSLPSSFPAFDIQFELSHMCFSAPTIEEIFKRLESSKNPLATKTKESLLSRSPTSLKVTLAHFQKCQDLSTLDVLEQDFILAQSFLKDLDFFEGVRAQVIDKDRTPHWNPASLKEVTAEKVLSYLNNQGKQGF